MRVETLRALVLSALAVIVAGCATSIYPTSDGPPVRSHSNSELPPDAVPRVEPKSRYGNPASYVVFGKRYYTLGSADGFVEQGTASWYGKKFHGRRTSSGETYDMHAMTAAHKSLPLPTYVQVTNLTNGRSTVVKVNDRGPFVGERIIDLSFSAARKLDMVRAGIAHVEIRSLVPGAAVSKSPAAPAYAPAAGEHYVQAGAFISAENAAVRLAEVRSVVNATAAMYRRQRGTVQYHVVWVGPFAELAGATRMSVDLRNAGILGVRIVNDP